MIETNNPEINVDKLMVKIREEVANRRMSTTMPSEDRSAAIDKSLFFDFLQIMANLSEAEQNANVGTSILAMKRFNIVIRWFAKLTGRAMIYLTQVISVPQRRFNQSILQVLRIITDGIRHLDQTLAERDNSLTQELAERDKRVVELTQELAERDKRVVELEGHVTQGLAERDKRVSSLEKSISYLKTSLVLQERRLSLLLEEARRRLPGPFDPGQLQALTNEELHLQDPLYVYFEDQFRGTRQDIKDQLKVYLPFIQEARAGTEQRPILDVGCGRGEWLELLKEEGLKASGLDINRMVVEQYSKHGMDVTEGDAVEYLLQCSDAYFGAVTSFHLIEHLPFRMLMKFFDETLRVLKSGGLAIFETPNPKNLIVGACNFYCDPGHLRPLYPETQKFLLEQKGFTDVRIIYLNPHEDFCRLPEHEAPQLGKILNELLSCAREYAVLGYKV